MKFIFMMLLCIFLSLVSFCQPAMLSKKMPQNISGIVVDNNKQPIEYVNLLLYNSLNSALITGVVSDSKGVFVFPNLQPGKYYINSKFIGFKEKKVLNLLLNYGKGDLILDTIELEPDAYQLKSVIVQGNAKSVENRLEKKVINVGKDIDAGTGNAADILQKAASVKIDDEGAVSLRGNDNVTILINGRQQTMSGQSVLTTIPASSIEKIEIISNPSAKYQAEGTAGIINLILKKNKKDNISVLASVKAGTARKYAANLNTFYSKGIYNFNLQLMYNNLGRCNNSYRNRLFNFPDSTVYFYDDFKNRRYRDVDNFVSVGSGIDLKNLEFFGSVKYGLFELNKIKTGEQTRRAEPESIGLDFWSQNITKIHWNYFETEINIKIKPNNTNHAMEFLLYRSQEIGKDSYNTHSYPKNSFNEKTGNDERITTDQTGHYHIYQAMFDYAYSLNKNNHFESGFFFKEVDRINIFNKGDFNFGTNTWDYNPEFENRVANTHLIYAGYLNLNGKWSKLNYQFGIRAEKEKRDIHMSMPDSSINFSTFDWFPSASLSFEITPNLNFVSTFGKRKQVPKLWAVVPFTYVDDKNFSTVGNPLLRSEFAAKCDIGLEYSWEKLTGSFSYFINNRSNPIMLVQSTGGEFKSSGNWSNVRKHVMQGIEAGNKLPVSKHINISLDGSVYSNHFASDFKDKVFNNKAINWYANLIFDFTLGKSTKLQVFNSFGSKYTMLQGYYTPLYYTNLSLSHSMLNKSLVIGVKTNDIFQTRRTYANMHEWEGYYAEYFNWEKRYVLVSVMYNFNKYQNKQKAIESERGAM